jgi:hypothetical protein
MEVRLDIQGHREKLPMFVTKLGRHPIVLGIPWLKQHDVVIHFASNLVTFRSQHCLAHCVDRAITVRGASEEPPDALPIPEPPIQLLMSTDEGQEVTDLASSIPTEYHQFLHLFSEVEANKLPPHEAYDHRIPLQPNFTPPFGPIYPLSKTELEALRKWLDENLAKGFIRASSSPTGAPILFMKKGDGSLRLCVDYRGLNEGTIKNRYPLPLLHETLLQLQKVRFYTKLDIRGAYNLVRLAEGEEWKMAFRTHYGLFESLVMLFGLTNAPASFQHFINNVLQPYLDVFVTAYLDDILIYSDDLDEHHIHVQKVLQALSDADLHLKPEKCEFHQQEVKYLGFIISMDGTKMDPAKVTTIQEWLTPMNVKDMQSFLSFANFYRHFIRGYSAIVAPLTCLTRKNTACVWDTTYTDSFAALKHAFTTAPILHHFDYDHEAVIETDASDYVSVGILSQYNDEGILHPVAFVSKKHSPAECNYEIYDKELMAIVRAFEEWRPELEGVSHPIKVLSDHKNLEYFMTTKLLNRRQTCWAEYLSRFNFKIVYSPGKAGAKPDSLTHRSGDLPQGGDDRIVEQHKAVLKPHNLPDKLQLWEAVVATPRSALSQDILKATQTNPFAQWIITALFEGKQHSRDITLSECQVYDGRLYYQHRLYVPANDAL